MVQLVSGYIVTAMLSRVVLFMNKLNERYYTIPMAPKIHRQYCHRLKVDLVGPMAPILVVVVIISIAPV